MKKYLFCCFIFLASCATVQLDWQAIGGSRSDGTVELAYQYSILQTPVVDYQQGLDLAAKRCMSWGYSGAEEFGGEISTCRRPGSSGCAETFVTKQYQCLGHLEK